MLKLKDLIENFDLAKEILGNWEYDRDTIDGCLEYFRISSNAVYPFRQNGRLCFLRFAPVSEKQLSNIKGEIDFILYLRRNGFPALEPIMSKNGRYIITVQTAEGTFYATAFYAVEGEPIEDTDFSDTVCFQYGKTLGRLHRLSSEYEPATKKQDYKDILNLIQKRLCELDTGPSLVPLLEKLQNKLSLLPAHKSRYGLIHYDFECDNVFYDEKENTCHVIDFDDGIYHFYALDLEQALDSISEEAPEDKTLSAKNAFLKGYKSEYLFDGFTSSLLPLMRCFCDLYSYTRLLYCLSEDVPNPPDWMTELKEKLTNKAIYLKDKLLSSPL